MQDFHAPPLRIHARNQEAVYWGDFSTRISQTFPSVDQSIPVRATDDSWGLSGHGAAAAAEKQKIFFKAIDRLLHFLLIDYYLAVSLDFLASFHEWFYSKCGRN